MLPPPPEMLARLAAEENFSKTTAANDLESLSDEELERLTRP